VLREGPEDAGEDLSHTRLVDVPALVAESRAAGVPVEMNNELDDLAPVPEGVGRAVYQIVREALTNARKHAPGRPVTIGIAGAPGAGITIEIRNPLPAAAGGASGIPGTGTGLIGLGERAALAGGRLTHGRTADAQFRVHAWLPWSP
jgi:signal transduction histidine kinase